MARSLEKLSVLSLIFFAFAYLFLLSREYLHGGNLKSWGSFKKPNKNRERKNQLISLGGSLRRQRKSAMSFLVVHVSIVLGLDI